MSPYILKNIWCMNILLLDYESVWPEVWFQSKCTCRSQWPIFHGPVFFPYILKCFSCVYTFWLLVSMTQCLNYDTYFRVLPVYSFDFAQCRCDVDSCRILVSFYRQSAVQVSYTVLQQLLFRLFSLLFYIVQNIQTDFKSIFFSFQCVEMANFHHQNDRCIFHCLLFAFERQ